MNEEPVGAGEFIWFMQQERPAVFQEFKTRFNLDDGTNFWDCQISNTSPRACLRERTVSRVTQAKVEQKLFLELGLVKDIRYPTFLDTLEKFNHERESSAQKGAVLYGPIHYTQLQFYQHWMTELRTRAKEQLESHWDVSEEKVRDFFERHREQFGRRKDGAQTIPSFEEVKSVARAQYLDSLYDQSIVERVKSAKLRLNQSKLDALIQ